MSYPLVSIALCTYNGEHYLVEQLDSLVTQTYQNLEIIVVDDLSRDNTLAIAENYARRYPIIKIYQNTENLGYNKNFEKAISLCKGELIALSDQDDIWDITKIAIQVEHIKDNMLIYHDSELIDENGKSLNNFVFNICNPYRGRDPRNFILGNCVSGHTVLFKRDLIKYMGSFPKELHYDQWLAYVATSIGKIDYLNLALVKFRRHNSNSTDILRQNKTRAIVKNMNLEEWRKLNHFFNYKHSLISKFLNELIYLARQKKIFGFNFRLFNFLFKYKYVLLSTSKKSSLSKLNYLFKYTSKLTEKR